MKIIIYNESKKAKDLIELDVPDSDCEMWVETDYQRRLSEADDKSSVCRRTVQEIVDEEANKPVFNNNHAETRRHVSLNEIDPLGDTLIGEENTPSAIASEEYESLNAAVKTLRPEQKLLIRKVYFEKVTQVEIARAEGVDESAISKRMARIYARLKNSMLK